MGLIFFAEVPAALAIAGGVLSLIGVALSRRKPRVAAAVPAGPESLPE
jgi:drug/metabolite transporter (DMT)-like permease